MPKICEPAPPSIPVYTSPTNLGLYFGGLLTDTRIFFYWGQSFPSGSSAEMLPFGESQEIYVNGVRLGLSNGRNIYPLDIRCMDERGTPIQPTTPPDGDRNCYCSPDSCRVDCATSPDGFCCIDHAVTDRLLQVLNQ